MGNIIKKIVAVLLCVGGISLVHADGGLFGLIGSAINTVSGNGSSTGNSGGQTDANGGINDLKVNVDKVDDGWVIMKYKDPKIDNTQNCSNG